MGNELVIELYEAPPYELLSELPIDSEDIYIIKKRNLSGGDEIVQIVITAISSTLATILKNYISEQLSSKKKVKAKVDKKEIRKITEKEIRRLLDIRIKKNA